MLVDQGRMHGLVNGGMISLDWLRVENGGCKWGQELDALTTPLEAGLSHLIDWKKVLSFSKSIWPVTFILNVHVLTGDCRTLLATLR